MNFPWGDPRSHSFVTNVGLLTSDGPLGPNIMACEWTHHVSYEPGLIAVCVGPDHATHENIAATREFGVSIAASDQNVLANTAGGSTGREIDKMKVCEELGFRFIKAKRIRPPLVEGAVLMAECRLKERITLGDHTMFVGDVLEAVRDATKIPLIYHSGKFWQFGESIAKPSQNERDRIGKIVEQHRRK